MQKWRDIVDTPVIMHVKKNRKIYALQVFEGRKYR